MKAHRQKEKWQEFLLNSRLVHQLDHPDVLKHCNAFVQNTKEYR
jgi:hypothetical protein